MADTRNTGRIKKYGVCLNDKCEKYKVIQEIVHGDLECPECKKKLSPCAPPKQKSSKKPLYIGIAAIAVVGAIVGGIAMFTGSSDDLQTALPTDSIDSNDSVKTDVETNAKQDSVVQNKTATSTSETESAKTSMTPTTPTKPKGSNSGNGTLRLSYGTYTGATKGGYPHGQGRLTYSKSRQINRNDVKGRTANAGDYVIGEFFNGFVVYGKHYDSSGNLLGSLNFGVGSESSYESK